MAIRLVIGCCNYIFGECLKKLLQSEKGISVVGIFDESIDFKEIVKLEPDLILTDLSVFRRFTDDSFDKLSNTKILLLAERSWLSTAYMQIPHLVSKGVAGILPPGTDLELLKKALKVVFQGELWLNHKIVKDVLSLSNSEKNSEFTKMERDVLSLICQGFRNKEIAQQLNISEQTVKSHCNRIYKKVGVTDKVQLVLKLFKTSPDLIESIKTKV
jgi:DNA-binding NarL/FixJ family response regulator